MTADVAATTRRSSLGATGPGRSVLASADGVELAEVPFLAQLNVRADPTGGASAAVKSAFGIVLPTEPNTSTTAGDVRALWLAPDEWLLVAGADEDPGGLAARVEEALHSVGGTLVDVSAHRTTLELRGPRAREVLESGCSVDLHPRAFGVDDAVQAPLARVDVILVRVGEDVFHVLVRTSFARYLATWLIEAISRPD